MPEEKGESIMKSDGEASILVVKEAVMKYHGGNSYPKCPQKGKTRKRVDGRGRQHNTRVHMHLYIPDRGGSR